MSKLTPKQKTFVEGKIKGLSNYKSAVMAGYNPNSASVQGSRLLKNVKIIEALDNAGLSDKVLADSMNVAMTSGLGIKATNADAIHVIELATRLKGYQANDKPESLTQNNIYINELKNLDDTALQARLDAIASSIEKL